MFFSQRSSILSGDLGGECCKWLYSVNKYTLLYGLRLTKEDHVFLARVAFNVFVAPDLDTYYVEWVGQTLQQLLKKKYLLVRADLELPWRPLFDLYYKYEESSEAIRWGNKCAIVEKYGAFLNVFYFYFRGMVKCSSNFKSQLQWVIKYSRSYFPESATKYDKRQSCCIFLPVVFLNAQCPFFSREMLAEWTPMLCPADRSMGLALKYMTLFLPTSSELDPERAYKLWFNPLMRLWESFSNFPIWETDLFKLLSRLAFHNVGAVEWGPHLEPIFARIMNALK